ncbi:MAG: dienelactone hydrolase family protein [Dehalococcoidia bacterium]
MCFPYDARPPIEPISGAAVNTSDVTLKSADGAEFAAFSASTDTPGGPAVVIMPDVRGLYPFYEELAERFAERGIEAIAIDYFGRTAGVGKRGEDFPYPDHVAQTKVEQITADVGAAVEYLRRGEASAMRPVFTVGFCFGGGNSWIQAAGGHGLNGVVGFYGHPTRPGRDDSPPPIDRVPEITVPLLGLMGGADQGIPVEEVQKFEETLSKAEVEHEIYVYPGAPHSFFDRRFEEHADAAADAWNRVLGFIEKNSR